MLSSALTQCKPEADLVGAMLANYGELEFALTNCLGAVIDDFDIAMRLIYGDRGEERRINVCQTLMRKRFERIGLLSLFEETIAQIRYCKIIRNQYAHGWFSWSAISVGWGGGPRPRNVTLKLVSLEDVVNDPNGSKSAPKNLPLNLLQDQAAYFVNALEWIMWLQFQSENVAAGNRVTATTKPVRLSKPKRWVEP